MIESVIQVEVRFHYDKLKYKKLGDEHDLIKIFDGIIQKNYGEIVYYDNIHNQSEFWMGFDIKKKYIDKLCADLYNK